MIKLKDILKNNSLLNENPDGFLYKNRFYSYSEDGVYTFMVYDDLVDKKKYWVAWDTKNDRFLCENNQVVQEITNFKQKNSDFLKNRKKPVGNLESLVSRWTYDDIIGEMSRQKSHYNLLKLLCFFKRADLLRSQVKCDGRVFEFFNDKSQYLMSFWVPSSAVRGFKNKIDDFLNEVGIPRSNILFELYGSDLSDEPSEFENYNTFFGSTPAELSGFEKSKAEMAKQLHMNKAMLDKAILTILRDNPKDVETLYARLEKQFNMPVVKIRDMFKNVPLNSILNRKLNDDINGIKLIDILVEMFVSEGGKLFGSRASRVTTLEMNNIFDELKKRVGNRFTKFELSKALPAKQDHGDIDIVLTGNPDIKKAVMTYLGPKIKDYSRNGNIHSVLYSSDLGKDVHVDFIYSTTDDDFEAQRTYLALGDFSGILGVMARQNGYKYATTGFYKIYVDKIGRHHDILITKNLKDGLKILGYGDVLNTYDNIQTNDDVVKFISSSSLFDIDYYKGQTMNHSDRKRVRAGRPSADYIRKSLISLNKHKTIEDPDYFLKKLFPEKYQVYLNKIKEIESVVPVKSKYGGDWIMSNFPQIKPGPVLGKIKQFWTQKYGDKLDNVPEDQLKSDTDTYIKTL